ncbi:MAG: SulP family inorganic anion transporter [Pseudomonadota bacterium]|jgi:SulP family sulfate permease
MIKRYFPILSWLPHYHRRLLGADVLAGLIVTMMVIPQSLAYALLAGLPAVVGLYASILPQLVYTLFGTSRTLAIGPVAIIALMTAAALSGVATPGSAAYLEAALVLAVLSGAILIAMGLLKMGFFSNFLSHPVISGFLTASGILIAASQFSALLGVDSQGFTLVERLVSVVPELPRVHVPTLIIGVGTLVFLIVMRRYAKPLLQQWGMNAMLADLIAKAGPVFAVLTTTWITWFWQLDTTGVAVVGSIPMGMPPLGIPMPEAALWQALLMPALLISLVGFVESVSMGQMLAAKRRQRISPNQELIGLGAANLAGGVSGAMPVAGGLSRTVINFDAGAQTPAAGAFAALGIALVTFTFTGWLHYLPIATLAATITVSILTLVDVATLRQTWRYSRSDFSAMAMTIALTLIEGVEAGILTGVVLSIGLFLYRTSRPNSALLGRVADSEQFRSIARHDVKTHSHVAFLRIDESLYFANARYLEDTLYNLVATRPELEHVVIVCSAVNLIDASALESLEAINARLKDASVKLHLAEVKGPVMDKLKRSDLPEQLTGRIFLSTYAAWRELDND